MWLNLYSRLFYNLLKTAEWQQQNGQTLFTVTKVTGNAFKENPNDKSVKGQKQSLTVGMLCIDLNIQLTQSNIAHISVYYFVLKLGYKTEHLDSDSTTADYKHCYKAWNHAASNKHFSYSSGSLFF